MSSPRESTLEEAISKKTIETVEKIPKEATFKDLIQFAGRTKPLFLLAIILAAISTIFLMLPYVSLYHAIEIILYTLPNLSTLDPSTLVYYGIQAVIFALIGFAINFCALMCSHLTAFTIQKNMKSKILHHIIKLPMGFFNQNSTGKLRKVIDTNTTEIEEYIAHQLPDTASSLLSPFIILVLLFSFDWRMGLASILTLALTFFTQAFMSSGKVFLKKYQDALEDMNKEAVEYVRGISVVKIFGQTVHSFTSFKNAILSYRDFALSYSLSCKKPMSFFVVFTNSVFFFLIPLTIFLSTGALEAAGVAGTTDYRSILLSFIFYAIFTPACGGMFMKIMFMMSYRMVAMESTNRVLSLLEQEPLAIPSNPEEPKNNTITLTDVIFTYPGASRPAIQNISLHVKEGQTIGLVGASGSGKSTIATLIPRFFDVDSGSISVGGVNIKNISQETLMQKISFVFQDSKLFKGSIRENLKIVRENLTEEDIQKALIAAQCTDIIKALPEGIDTLIGAGGVHLSGGEYQRISLARAILKDSPIIILDEATAFADPENQYKIQLAFEKLAQNKTVLMIAHRLSTIKNADQIFVIDEGKILESGSHTNLLDKKGTYFLLWEEYQKTLSWRSNYA